MNSDYLFNKWIDTSVHLFSKFSDQPVYYYNYGHKGQYSLDLFVAAPPGFNQGSTLNSVTGNIALKLDCVNS